MLSPLSACLWKHCKVWGCCFHIPPLPFTMSMRKNEFYQIFLWRWVWQPILEIWPCKSSSKVIMTQRWFQNGASTSVTKSLWSAMPRSTSGVTDLTGEDIPVTQQQFTVSSSKLPCCKSGNVCWKNINLIFILIIEINNFCLKRAERWAAASLYV